jgi:hypothetical protein
MIAAIRSRLDLAPDCFGDGSNPPNEIGKHFWPQRLFAIAPGTLGIVVHFNHQRVGPGRDRGERHLRHEIAQANTVGRIDHDWQARLRF